MGIKEQKGHNSYTFFLEAFNSSETTEMETGNEPTNALTTACSCRDKADPWRLNTPPKHFLLKRFYQQKKNHRSPFLRWGGWTFRRGEWKFARKGGCQEGAAG